METGCDLSKKSKLENLHRDIWDAKIKREKEREKREERMYKLNIYVGEGSTAPPKGLWRWKKCPDCGEKLHLEKWRDGGYPDYGHKYIHYICDNCSYEYESEVRELEHFEVGVVMIAVPAIVVVCLFYIILIAEGLASLFGLNLGITDFLRQLV